MASSNATTPPVSLKERIAALNQRNGPASPPATSPGASLSPSRTVTPTSPSGNTSPGVSAASLRDKISKFEKKGGTPIPRGSFGIGAPPPPPDVATRRKGELYGNRVPGLGRPQHGTPAFGRSATGLQSASEGETAPPRRAVSSVVLGSGMGSADPSRSTSPEPTSGQVSPHVDASRPATPLGEVIRAGSTCPRSPPVGGESTPAEGSFFAEVARGTSSSADAGAEENQDTIGASSKAREPAPANEDVVKLDVNAPVPTSLQDLCAPTAVALATTPDVAGPAMPPQEVVPVLAVEEAPKLSPDSDPIVPTPPESASPTGAPPAVSAAAPSKSALSPKTTAQLVVTPPTFKQAAASSITPTPVSAADSEASDLAALITRYAAPTSPVDATQGLSALAANVKTLGHPPTPHSASSATTSTTSTSTFTTKSTSPSSTTVPTITIAPSSLAIPSAVPDTPSMYSASSASAYSPSVHSPADVPGSVANSVPPVKSATSKPSVPVLLPQPEYIEPIIGPPPAERKRTTSFKATIHRKAATEPPLPSAIQREPPQPRARVPTQTVASSDASEVSDELSSLLSNAWRLEERLETGPIGTSQTDTFADMMSNAFANIGGALSEPAAPVQNDGAARVRTHSSHKRTDSNVTLKAMEESTSPAAAPVVQEPEQIVEVHNYVHISNDESSSMPPPKSGGRFSSLRAKTKGGSLKNRMSMLIPEGRESRQSITSPDERGSSSDFEHVSPPRMSRSSGHLRDDVSMSSRQSGGSSWSFRSGGSSRKGLQRAATFAEKFWPGNRSKSRTPSTMSAVSADNTIEEDAASSARSPSPAPSLDPLRLGEPLVPGQTNSPASVTSRPDSWLSGSSALSSPNLDARFFDQFPSVPSGDARAGEGHGTLQVPPARSSSLLSATR